MKHNELFKAPAKRLLSKVAIKMVVTPFLEKGCHHSPSGLTASAIVDHCLHHDIPFTVEYNPEFGGIFTVNLIKRK